MPKRPLPNNIDDQMLDATVTIGAHCGVCKVTTLKVAEACGVAEITVYRHFESKENLLYQAFLRFDRRVQEVLNAEKRGSLDLSLHIKNCWFRVFDYLVRHPKQLSFYNQYVHLPVYKREQDPRFGDVGDCIFRCALYGNPSLSSLMGMGPEILWTATMQTTMVFAEKIARGMIRDTVQIREYLFFMLFGDILSGLATRAAFRE